MFRILQILLERAGEVVTKEELMKQVWPDSFVEEGNLNRNVSTLRKALGEKPCDHRYIETVPKTGYRFVASVRRIEYQPPAGSMRTAANRLGPQLVGRHTERDILRQAFDRARQGNGGLVCVSGGLGLGKTALVDAFLAGLTADQRTVHLARARCSESFTESEPLIPWIEGLSTLAQEPALRSLMKSVAPNWYREITHAGSGMSRRMKRELVDLCREISVVHPLIVVIDDFHWADVTSVDLLAHLAPRLDQARVLVVLCYRPVEMNIRKHPFIPVCSDLVSRGACTEVHLTPLSRNQVEEYLALPQLNCVHSAEFAGRLHAKSDGNPLFLREFLSGGEEVSDAVRHMIQTQLDRLDDTHQQLLVTASIQGREFDSAVLAATMQMGSQDVEEALQELDEVHGFIQRIREEELPDGKFTVRYRFVYELYQEACYASLAPTRKASLRASLAETLLAYYGN